MRLISIMLFVLLSSALKAQVSVTFDKSFESEHSSLEITLKDVEVLIEKATTQLTDSIRLNIHFDRILESETIRTPINYEEHKYILDYSFNTLTNSAELHVESRSIQGLVFGIYGFLQDYLGIKFYHPKETQFPINKKWELKKSFTTHAKPKFQLKGFHLHTQHPIELTEYLLDETWGEKGILEVKHYIDWLVRNRQNYFQFVLLESVKVKKWSPYFKQIEEYAHKRGVMVGLALSLHSIQQKAYMLYNNWPKSWLGRKKQISNRIERLNKEIKWDYWSVDFKKHEFTEDKSLKIDKYKSHVFNELQQYNVRLAEHYHIVDQPDHLSYAIDSSYQKFLNETAGLIHTVMFYSLTDEKAPVYENENFHHMLEKLENSVKERETWYFPESAYWVTFDNSIPMTLTPYLQARLDDINTTSSLRTDGHVTFSSGWEWGYWLFDWSIARWSWDNQKEHESTEYLKELVPNKNNIEIFEELTQLQQEYIKDSNLIAYLTAQAPTDELPKWMFNKEFHPRPNISYKRIRNRANKNELQEVNRKVLLLEKFHREAIALTNNITYNIEDVVTSEFTMGFEMTAWRAKHKSLILQYLVEKRTLYFDRKRSDYRLDSLMREAISVREHAQQLVNYQQTSYRYPSMLVGSKYKGKTAYPFGYLYTVANLHFWEREEKQAKKNKYKAKFMNVYPLLRIAGFID